jgi:hypothetical protein
VSIWRGNYGALKNLTIGVTLLVIGASMAMAQNAPATGGQPPVSSGAAAGSAAAPGTPAKSTKKHKQTKKAPAAATTPQQ